MVEAATNFEKAGYTDEQSKNLAVIASRLQNVADESLTAGEATDFLVSQMQAFNITAEDSEHIADAINEVAANYAVTTGDLMRSLPKTSAALAVGNNTMEETIGLLTGITEVTRNSSRAARGLVSVQSRLNQITDEESSTGKKLTAWYKEHNIAIYDQEGQLRSLYDILSDLAPQWESLTTNEKDYYLNIQAGANQSVNLAAALSNFNHVAEATETAMDSAGSAIRQNGVYMESLEAHLNGVKGAWQDFSNSVIDSDLVKVLLDLAKNVLAVLNTNIGTSVTQFGLLFAVFLGSGVIAIQVIKNLAASFGIATTSIIGFKAAVLPIAGILAALITGGIVFHKATENSRKSIEDLNSEIDANKEKLKSYHDRLDEINAMVWSDRTPEIEAERQELEKSIKKLDNYNDKLTRIAENKAWGIINYNQTLIGGEGKRVTTRQDELIDKARQLTYILNKYHTLTEEQLKDYQNVTTELGGIANAMEEVNYQGDDMPKVTSAVNDLTQAYSDADEYSKNLADAVSITDEQLKNLSATELQERGILEKTTDGWVLHTNAIQDAATTATNSVSAFVSADGRIYQANKDMVDGCLANLEALISAQEAIIGAFYAQSGPWDFKSAEYKKYMQAVETNRGLQRAKTTITQARAKSQKLGYAPSPSGTGGGGGGGSSGKSSRSRSTRDKNKTPTDQALEDFKAAYKELQHQHNMGVIEDAEYYKKLQENVDKYKNSKGATLSEMYQYEEEIYKGEKQLSENHQKDLEDEQKKQKENLEAVIAYAQSFAQEQQDAIDKQLDSIKDQIDAINKEYDEQIKKLEKTNSELNEQLKLEQLLENLASAKAKRGLVYKDGQFQYVEDADAISSAQSELDEYNREQLLNDEKELIEEQRKDALKSLEDKQKALEDEKKQWQEYSDGWSKLSSDYTQSQNALIAQQKYGIDLEKENWNERLSNLKSFTSEYIDTLNKIDSANNKSTGSKATPTSGSGTGYHFSDKGGSGGWTEAEMSEGFSKSKSSSSSSRTSSGVALGLSIAKSVASRLVGGKKHANGTYNAPGGLSLVGENGPELRVLNPGDGIIPSDITRNLMNIGANTMSSGSTFYFGDISLPGVTNAQEFVNGIKRLAYQRAYKRV